MCKHAHVFPFTLVFSLNAQATHAIEGAMKEALDAQKEGRPATILFNMCGTLWICQYLTVFDHFNPNQGRELFTPTRMDCANFDLFGQDTDTLT